MYSMPGVSKLLATQCKSDLLAIVIVVKLSLGLAQNISVTISVTYK